MISKKVSEYNREIAQSHTADQPTTLWGRAAEHLQQQYILLNIYIIIVDSLSNKSRVT